MLKNQSVLGHETGVNKLQRQRDAFTVSATKPQISNRKVSAKSCLTKMKKHSVNNPQINEEITMKLSLNGVKSAAYRPRRKYHIVWEKQTDLECGYMCAEFRPELCVMGVCVGGGAVKRSKGLVIAGWREQVQLAPRRG